MTAEYPEGSALQNVFGSEVSLAEISGDVRSFSPKPGYSRFGLPEHKITRSMHGQAHDRHKSTHSPKQKGLWWRLSVLSALGGTYTLLLQYHIRINVNTAGIAVCSFGCLLGLLIGISFPAVDAWLGQRPNMASRSSVMQAFGALLGLVYGAAHLDQAFPFWSLANLFLWFVLDKTWQGFALSTVICLALAKLISPWVYDGENWHEHLLRPATSVFCMCIVIGCVGRRLLASPSG